MSDDTKLLNISMSLQFCINLFQDKSQLSYYLNEEDEPLPENMRKYSRNGLREFVIENMYNSHY